jgi:hypothetical protein
LKQKLGLLKAKVVNQCTREIAMKRLRAVYQLVILVIGTIICPWISASEAIVVLLKEKDALMFEQGFNQCNLAITAELITDDLEFYHDNGGIDKGKNAFLQTLKEGLCRTGNNPIRRHLVSNSLSVFPMYDNGKLYGAIQMGKHGFAAPDENFDGKAASFIHLWLIEDDKWKIARVMSYDHPQ